MKLGGESVYSTGLRAAAYALGRNSAFDAVPHVFCDGHVRPEPAVCAACGICLIADVLSNRPMKRGCCPDGDN
jgi:hypothetical protein